MIADRTVTIAQAAQITGVTRRTIYHWLQAGKLRYRRTAGGRIRIVEWSLWRDAESLNRSLAQDALTAETP